ncbi:MAG: hypothetical protein Unbinned338contig1000_34 [Prokaryotic dsDNA virus sp.]|nr:MAG: hypothetical protein Unbinned338contig1000_34 [Prokaryotic dsDNA virus sp.]
MTKYTELQIGDAVPLGAVRGVLTNERIMRGGVPASVWHPLRVAPGKERAAIASLARDKVTAFCPMDDRERVHRGQRITYQVPHVSQIIYAKFQHRPRWDVLQERRIITGVMCIGERPVVLGRDTIRILRGLTERAGKMVARADRVKAARDEMMRLNAGDEVEIVGGPMAGFRVQVTGHKAGLVWWNMLAENGMPITGQVSRDGVVKVGLA